MNKHIVRGYAPHMQNWASVPYIRRVVYHELIGKRSTGGNGRAGDDQLLNG